jgi:deazaflavin-dependent oxidoreductase (nitroreductase family)
MKRTFRLLGLSGIALGVTWYVATRRRDELRGFVTHRLDPLVLRLGLAGGRVSRWATVEHVGRISGTTYHTPIYPMTFDDHVYVLLPLGTDTQWARNVQAAGHCRMQLHETILDLDEPAIVPASENPTLPAWLAGALGRAGRPYLRLHILDRVPAAFTRDVPASATAATEEHPIEIVHPAEAASGELLGV